MATMATKHWPPTMIAARCPECGQDFVYPDGLPSTWMLWCPHCDYGSYDRERFRVDVRTITETTETTITVWRKGQDTRRNRVRHWIRQRLASIGIGRTVRRIKPGDAITFVDGAGMSKRWVRIAANDPSRASITDAETGAYNEIEGDE